MSLGRGFGEDRVDDDQLGPAFNCVQDGTLAPIVGRVRARPHGGEGIATPQEDQPGLVVVVFRPVTEGGNESQHPVHIAIVAAHPVRGAVHDGQLHK